MSIRHILVGLSLLVFAVACAGADIASPPAGLSHAAATLSCGPTDGPATAIYLAHDPVEWLEPDYPYLRVAIWQPLAHLSGGSWRVASGDTAAAAWYFSGPNEFEIASAGRVAVPPAAEPLAERG